MEIFYMRIFICLFICFTLESSSTFAAAPSVPNIDEQISFWEKTWSVHPANFSTIPPKTDLEFWGTTHMPSLETPANWGKNYVKEFLTQTGRMIDFPLVEKLWEELKSSDLLSPGRFIFYVEGLAKIMDAEKIEDNYIQNIWHPTNPSPRNFAILFAKGGGLKLERFSKAVLDLETPLTLSALPWPGHIKGSPHMDAYETSCRFLWHDFDHSGGLMEYLRSPLWGILGKIKARTPQDEKLLFIMLHETVLKSIEIKKPASEREAFQAICRHHINDCTKEAFFKEVLSFSDIQGYALPHNCRLQLDSEIDDVRPTPAHLLDFDNLSSPYNNVSVQVTFLSCQEVGPEHWKRFFKIDLVEMDHLSLLDSALFSKTYKADMKKGFGTRLWDFLKFFPKEIDVKLSAIAPDCRTLRERLIALSDIMVEEFRAFQARHEPLFSEDAWSPETASNFLDQLETAKNSGYAIYQEWEKHRYS